jgi:hypothetical protein
MQKKSHTKKFKRMRLISSKYFVKSKKFTVLKVLNSSLNRVLSNKTADLTLNLFDYGHN